MKFPEADAAAKKVGVGGESDGVIDRDLIAVPGEGAVEAHGLD